MERSVARVHGDINTSTLPQPSKEDLVLLIGQTNELIINLTIIMKQEKKVALLLHKKLLLSEPPQLRDKLSTGKSRHREVLGVVTLQLIPFHSAAVKM